MYSLCLEHCKCSHIILQHHSQLDSDQSVADYHLDHYYESSYKIALFTSSSSFRFRTRYMCTLHSCVKCARIAFQYPDTKDEVGFWSVKLNSWVVETRVRKALETWLITERETP